MLGFAFAQLNLRLVAIRRGEVPSPDGLGDPTPTGSGCEVSAVFNPCNLCNPFNPRFRRVSFYASRFTFHTFYTFIAPLGFCWFIRALVHLCRNLHKGYGIGRLRKRRHTECAYYFILLL